MFIVLIKIIIMIINIILVIIVNVIKYHLQLNNNSRWDSDRPVAVVSQLLHLWQVVDLQHQGNDQIVHQDDKAMVMWSTWHII